MSNFDERWYEHTDSYGNKYYDHEDPRPSGPLPVWVVVFAMVIGYFIAYYVMICPEGLWIKLVLAVVAGLIGRGLFMDSFSSHLKLTLVSVVVASIELIAIVMTEHDTEHTMSVTGYILYYLFAILV